MPHGAHALWLHNRRAMTRLMFEQVHATLSELLEDPTYLGAKVGVIAALHTWGQTLVWHPHIHCLVTGGGLRADGTWRSVKNGYLVPVRVVRAVFARRMLAAMHAALRRGELEVPPGQQVDRWQRVLVKLGKAKWHVKVMKRYSHGQGLATYLARYLRGGPIRDRRILACDGNVVRFSYLDNRSTKRADHKVRGTMELPIDEFLRRLFQHVPEPNVHVVRHWGLYSPNKADDLARCRQQLGQPPVAPAERLDWQACCARAGGRQRHCCPVCGAQLVAGPVVEPQRQEPRKWPRSQAA